MRSPPRSTRTHTLCHYTTLFRSRSVMAAGLAMGSSAAAQTVMRISISSPQNSHQGVAIDTFAKEVERLTNGRYVIKTFYASSLGAEREAMESVQMGTKELTWTSSGPVPNFRSEERREGKECVSTFRSRWSPET